MVEIAASATTATFNVFVTSCSDNNGIQFGVYQGTNCNNFILMTPASWTSSSSPMTPGSLSNIVASGLTPGQVYYIMIDGNAGDDCQYIIQAESGFMLGADISPDITICPYENAAIQITTSNTNANITWSSSPSDPSLSSQIHNVSINVQPTTTTTYSAYIKDSTGFCVIDTTLQCVVTVLAPNDPNCYSPISCTINKTDATQCPVAPANVCNGTATVVVTGATGSFQYAWNDGNTSDFRNNLCAGTYTVTVSLPGTSTPPTNCFVTINGPSVPTISLSPQNACPEGSNGSINLSILSGQQPCTFIWSSGQQSEDISNLSAGTYVVTVTDFGHCSVSDSIVVSEFAHYSLTLSPPSDSICPGFSSTLSVSGAISYHWAGNGLSNTTNSVVYATPSVPTTYSVTGTNNNGCTESATVSVSLLPKPTVTASVQPNGICSGQTSTLTASGASSYVWTGGTNPTSGSVVSASPLSTTQYYVIGTNSQGCKDTADVIVNILPNPSVNFTFSGSGCSPVEVHMTDNTPDTIVEWRWNLGDGSNATGINEVTHTYSATTSPKSYTLSLWVKDNHGCVAEMSVPNAIMVYPVPVAELIANPEFAYPNQEVEFTGNTEYGINSWYWNFGEENTGYATSLTQTTTHQFGVTGIYTVTLIVETSGGCKDTTTVDVEIIGIQIPNVFTPNGDGLNDKLVIKNIEKLENSYLQVYNRWGKKVFESYNYQNDWDGENCAEGIYFYILKLVEGSSFEGSITLLRK